MSDETYPVVVDKATHAIQILAHQRELFHYFGLTYHSSLGWKCHLTLSYSNTQYVDKYGRPIFDIYATSAHKDEPVLAVRAAVSLLHERAAAKLAARNEGPSPKTITELTRGHKLEEQSAEALLKELGL